MASTLGGWYLNNKGVLEYRLLGADGKQTTTVLASITGLTGLKMEDGVVKVNRGGGEWSEINTETAKDITVTATEAVAANPDADPPVAAVPETATFEIANTVLGTSKISVKGSTGYAAYMDLADDSRKVHIDGTEVIKYDNSGGKATVVGDLTAGFTLDKLNGNATSATYSNAAVNQTLATVTGLAKGYDDSTVDFAATSTDATTGELNAGTITLSKATDGEVSALGTTVIKVAMSNIANNNGIAYYLALGEDKEKEETYAQVKANDEPAYWTVNKTTATYQYYSPTGYTLNDTTGKATQVNITAAKTTVVATVTGLAADLTTNITDEKQYPDAVGTGRSRITNEFKSGITIAANGALKKPTYKEDGKTLETDNEGNVTGKGSVTINISKVALPTSGTVTVTAGKDFTVSTTPGDDFNKAEADGSAPDVVKDQYIWVVSGNKAIYEKVDLAYYTFTDKTTDKSGKITDTENVDKNGNTITRIICKPQGKATVLATITGLDADYLANEANLVRGVPKDTNGVITHINGINVTGTAKAAETKVEGKKTVVTKAAIPGEITLSSEVLGTTNVSLAKSDNYRLALATEGIIGDADSDKAITDGTSAVDLPTFSDYKWNLVGTTATLKGTVGAGYTASDDGKTITYTAGGDNQTLATVSGLKKGTQLNKGDNDERTIGNYINGSFINGLVIETGSAADEETDDTGDGDEEAESTTGGKLSHETKSLTTSTGQSYDAKILSRLPITLSKHVMDGKVTLNSNFFTLAINQDTTGLFKADATEAEKIVAKADSRTYVLTKGELYKTETQTVNGKEKEVTVPVSGADAIVGWHGSLGATAILKTTTPACYELATDVYGTTKTINYTAPPKATTVATIKGLNSAITEDDIEVGTTPDDNGKIPITIKSANALTTGNVTITSTAYKLALATETKKVEGEGEEKEVITFVDGLGEAELDNYEWSQATNGTVSFKATVTSPGYQLNADENIITYTKKASTPTTLATITGLRANLDRVTQAETDDSGSSSDSDDASVGEQGNVTDGDATVNETSLQYNGVDFNEKDGTITLSKSALGTSKVVLSGAGNYKLLVDEDTVDTEKKTAADAEDRWVISGTNAIFKKVIPDYYTLTDNTLTYTAATDVKYQKTNKEATDGTYDEAKAGKSIVHGTIQGLKSGLTVNADGETIGYYKDGKFVEAITVGEEDSDGIKVITIKDDGVLDYKNSVKLDATAIASGYRIYLDTSEEITKTVDGVEVTKTLDQWLRPEADENTLAWSINRGTATYKGSIGAGYANSDGTAINYSAANNNATIATITGLNTTLTSVGDDDLEFGAGDDTNVITVTADMLGTTDAKLTTNIAILGTNYKLALDEYNKTTNPTGVVMADSVEWKKIWTIDSTNATSTTATYGTWKDNYYTLNNGQNEGSDTITYHKAGVADTDKIAKVTGLAGNLVTIQGGQIRGIATDDTDNTITLSSTVLPTTTGSTVELEKLNGNEYTLALNDDEVESKAIPTPKPDAIGYKISAGDYATVTITQETSAGFVYGDDATEYEPNASDKTKLVYKASTPTGDKSIGEISGLNKNVAVNAEGKIDGITVDTSKDEITLSQAALSNQTVKLTTDSDYKLVLGTVEKFTADPVWEAVSVKKGEAPKYKLLIGQATSGYGLEEGGKQITYKGGGSGTHVATITGLKNPTNDNVKIEGTKIIISAGALNAQEVSIENADGYTYTLALNNPTLTEGQEKPAGFVEASKSKNAWTLTNGTATFTQTVTAGYAMNGGKVVYTPASSIVSTFTNFNKEATIVEQSDTNTLAISQETDNTTAPATTTYKGITFAAGDSGEGTFTITDADLLAHKNVKLTVKPTGKDSTGANVTADYTIVLDDDVAAEVYDPVWNKAENATVATYTRTTAAGYSLDSNSKNIVYSSDPTTVTLATVSGLNKESVVNEGKDAIGILDGTTFTAGLEVTKSIEDGNGTGVIKIGNNVLNNAKVTLGKTDKYTFDLDETDGNAVPTEAEVKPVWAQNKTTAIYKNVSTAYYGLAPGEREIVYNKETDYKKTGDDDTNKTTITTITGLKGGITINSDGTVKNADGTSSAGLTAGSSSSKVTVAAAVLGTTKVASDSYTFVLGSDVVDEDNYKGKTEWVDIGKGSYTYKTYDKAYYTINTNGNQEITYTPAKDITAYATVSGLKTGLTNANIGFAAADTNANNPNYSKGGVLTLGASQLGTGTAKLTTTANATGDFTLALDTTTDNKVTVSEIKDGTKAWTTKTTTATLTGTKTQGYTISEDSKSITYQAADKTVTLATVKGIKSGATIANTDVKEELTDPEDATSTTGNKIITLSASQLGTSNVTVTGDGYKLALGADADKSQNDDPAWVKAANATKATFTQTTYNGFREATDGKSLIYQSKTGTVDVATINGLNKTVTQDQMAIIEEASGNTALLGKAFTDGALVVVNKATNEIYLAKDALTTSAVTLGKNDDYTLKLYGGKDGAIGGEHVDNDIVFDKSTGTMSITTGDAAKWEETDDKTLKYTPSNYTNAATVTGLPKDLIFTEAQAGNKLQGITVDGNKITIGAEAVFKTKYNEETGEQEKTDESRLAGGSKITLTNYTVGGTLSEYTLEVDSNDDKTADQVDATPPVDHKKWVVTTKNLTLKEVTSAHYLASKVTENTRNKTSTQTITYVAEKIGGDLAVITGLPTGIKTNEKGTQVFLSDGTTEVISSTMSGNGAMGDKTVKLKYGFLNTTPDKALTITIAANKVAANQYKFVGEDDEDIKTKLTGGKDGGSKVDYTTTPTKGTATYQVKKTAGWTRVSNTQITYVTESGELLATFNGLNTSTDYSKNESAVAVNNNTNTVTVKATALTNKNVTVATPKGSTTVYKFALDSGVVDDSDTDDWKDKTDWAVGGGTATYKTYDKAYYKLQNAAKNPDTSPNSIVYVAPTKGTAYASITGLNKNVTSLNTDASTYDPVAADEIIITLGANELEGTTKVSLANAGAKLASYPRNPTPEQKEAVEVQNAITQGHNDTAAKFKLALDSGVDTSDIKNAVWDNNGKVATLTGTTTKGYKLSNDQKTITYQSADSKLQTIAKVTGIKSGSQITDDDVAALESTDDKRYNKNLPNLQYITLTEDHLGTDNVVLTGEGYKLALAEEVLTASESVSGGENSWKDQTEWVNSNGTFVYKTYNKAYYTLDEKTGMRVTYTAAKDDLKTAGTQHQTYLTISGLSKTATPTLAAAGEVASSTDDEDKTTITVTTAGTGVITLTNDELNKANVKLTDSQNGGYSLALDEHVTKSTVSNDSAVISGTKATWTGTQGKGYLLANDEQNVTYYSAAKTKQTIATVTGLASGITSANNDKFSGKYDADTNTVTLGKDDLSTNVVIGGTAEFKFEDDFTGGTVTGSAAADKMTFGAGNNTVNTGAGNDIVDFARKGGNTYLYANKSGNDVIRGFDVDTDVIRITNVVGTTSKTTTKTVDGEKKTETTYTNNITVAQDTKIAGDTLVKVGANTIRLKGVTAASVNVYDKNGYIWSSTATNEGGTPNGSFIKDTSASSASSEGGNVFADDNYAMTPNLSSIVKSSTASYTADDLVDDDATSLTKQSTAVSYSDKK